MRVQIFTVRKSTTTERINKSLKQLFRGHWPFSRSANRRTTGGQLQTDADNIRFRYLSLMADNSQQRNLKFQNDALEK